MCLGRPATRCSLGPISYLGKAQQWFDGVNDWRSYPSIVPFGDRILKPEIQSGRFEISEMRRSKI